jgi:hypothetical protein
MTIRPDVLAPADPLVAWTFHRRLTAAIPPGAAWRGCIGLGLLASPDAFIDLGDDAQLFVPDAAVAWAVLLDIPPGHWLGKNRPVHYGAVFQTAFEDGLPELSVRRGHRLAFDFARLPYRAGREGKPSMDRLNMDDHPQLTQVFNGLELAMTSTAMRFRRRWANYRPQFLQQIGAEGNDVPLLFGAGPEGTVAPAEVWFPRAYLGFPWSQAEALWRAETDAEKATEQPHLSRPLLQAFVGDVSRGLPLIAPFDGTFTGGGPETWEDVRCFRIDFETEGGTRCLYVSGRASLSIRPGEKVIANAVIGTEGLRRPPCWKGVRTQACREWLARSVGYAQAQFLLRAWWERQWRYIRPDYVHAPADLVCWVATRLLSADPSVLLWEVNRCQDYFRPDCNAFVFPTLTMRTWDQFHQALPGGLEGDFTPADPRFQPLPPSEDLVPSTEAPAAAAGVTERCAT